MLAHKFKVHSAIYSCSDTSSITKSAYDVTERIQNLLRGQNNDGVLQINNEIIDINNPCKANTFAIILTVIYPDGDLLTRFCTCKEGDSIDVKSSGVVCSF